MIGHLSALPAHPDGADAVEARFGGLKMDAQLLEFCSQCLDLVVADVIVDLTQSLQELKLGTER